MTEPPLTGTSDPSAADDAVRAQLQLALGAHYVLGREVGGGGMARVYVARDDSLGRDVAVKVFRPELAAALSAERFAREIRVAAALQEPHIVPVLAAGTTPGAPPAGGLPYYTMPFVRGESLRARLDRGGALPPAEAVAVLGDVLRALAHAHAHGVVHRDIKPENILLVAGGPSAAAVVTDFGIAKAVRASSPTGAGSGPADPGRADAGRADARRADRFGTAITGTGVALGTPAYMAPEQAAADPAVDERADLYAWGLVAYEALAGRHPFAAHAGAHAMVLAQLTARPAPLAALLPELPAPVADVVMRCLEKDPAARPPRATDALAALDLPRGWRAAPARRPVTAHAFRLSDAVLRRLDRATLDPRLLGGAMQYLENDAPPGVLLFCVHGLGHEGAEYASCSRRCRTAPSRRPCSASSPTPGARTAVRRPCTRGCRWPSRRTSACSAHYWTRASRASPPSGSYSSASRRGPISSCDSWRRRRRPTRRGWTDASRSGPTCRSPPASRAECSRACRTAPQRPPAPRRRTPARPASSPTSAVWVTTRGTSTSG
jgi:serine/threonine protein kinase